MRQFEENPRDRAFVDKHLPPELRSIIDSAENRMKVRVDELITEFRTGVRNKLAELTEKDFANELQGQIDDTFSGVFEGMSQSLGGIKQRIEDINTKIHEETQADAKIRTQIQELQNATKSLEETLNNSRTKVTTIGNIVGAKISNKINSVVGTIGKILE